MYAGLVARARDPRFYGTMAVPDTLDGRFDMIVLHAVLAVRRLGSAGPEGEELARDLLDVLFADMDRSLREMGVGDLGVGRRVRAMARAFRGRYRAYDEALGAGAGALRAALARNVFAGADAGEGLDALARYVERCVADLAAASDETLGSGTLPFPPPGGPLDG